MVVDNGDRIDITNVENKSRTYDISLGLSNKDKRQKITKTNKGVISFSEAMSGGIEAHSFNSSISLRKKNQARGGAETTKIQN